MLYQILFLWIFAFVKITPRTSLSKQNCPSKFYIDRANVTNITKQQMKSYASNFFSLYDNDNLKTTIQQLIINGNQKQFTKYINKTIVPFIIIIVIVFVSSVTLSICCIFSKTCPPDLFRRDLKKNPYTLIQFRIITALTILFSVAIVVTGLVGFSFIPIFKENVDNTKCSFYVILDVVLNGEQNTGWGGFNNLYDKIGNVSKFLTSSVPSMSLYLSGDQWLVDQMQNLKQMNLNLYGNNANSTLITPNPTQTKIALDNGLGYPRINSRFITKGLGPNGTYNTMVDDIDRGLRTTEVLSLQAYSIQISAKRLVDSSDILLSNTNSSRKIMEMYTSQLTNIKTYLDQLSNQYLTQLFHSGLSGFQAIFGILVIAALSCLMGVFSTYYFQIFSCKSMVTFAWVIYSLGLIGSLVIVYVTIGLGSLGYGFCGYMDSMMNQRVQFNKLAAADSQNPFNRMDACFFGDGNVLDKFDLGEQMGTVTELFANINKYYNFQDPLSTSYVDKSISTGKISSWMMTAYNYQKGIYIDYDQSVTKDDNPNYALNRLNLYTKEGGAFPTCAKDRWVFDSINCTLPNQTIYVASTAVNGQALETTNNSICISLNQKYSDLIKTSWTQGDFTSRYRQTRQKCPNAYDKILEYGYALIRFRESRQNLFKGIYDDLDVMHTKNVIFNNNITAFKDRVMGFQNTVSDLSNAVTNSINGLLVSSDCRAIVDDMKFSYNMFCINTMYDVIRIGWCSIIISLFSLIGMILGYIFSIWFGDVEKNNRWMEADYNPALDEISSSQMLKGEEEKDLGKDLQKLGQFTTYVGIKKQQKQQKKQKKAQNYDSGQQSEEQNPYDKELGEL